MMSFFLGVILLKKSFSEWKSSLIEWKNAEEIAKTLSVSQREKKRKELESEKRFRRFQYRIRVNLGLSLILLGVFLVGCGLFMQNTVMQNTENTQVREAVYCILAAIALVLWLCFWAVVDGIASYVYLSQENASEVIEEEKKYLRHAFENRNRDVESPKKKSDSEKSHFKIR
ncbi:MAG: hypothetical protein Q4C70_08675 [Planctomycetia bacterium]|nr:hypothetical protein [Planctomycetia bacterium]